MAQSDQINENSDSIEQKELDKAASFVASLKTYSPEIPNPEKVVNFKDPDQNAYIGDLIDFLEDHQKNHPDTDIFAVEVDKSAQTITISYQDPENENESYDFIISGADSDKPEISNVYRAIFGPDEIRNKTGKYQEKIEKIAANSGKNRQEISENITEIHFGFSLPEKQHSRILENPIGKEAIEILQNINPEEKLVTIPDPNGGKEIILRETVAKCLQKAQEYAAKEGYEIAVVSSFRNNQKEIFAKSDKSGKWVAPPGHSWHEGGAAIDVILKKNGKNLTFMESKGLRNKEHENNLARFMNMAGFVRYDAEWWHFEIGSRGWQSIVGNKLRVNSIYSRGENGGYTNYEPSQEELTQIIQDQPEMHEKYNEKISIITPETKEKDESKINNSTIEDIRFQVRLLNEKKENESPKEQILGIREETARRIALYSILEGDWHVLDYANRDSKKTISDGRNHENDVGLGDILLDPGITTIYVWRKGEKPFKATRGIVPNSKKYAGRIAFLDQNQNYVATHTGDKFRIATNMDFDLETASDEAINKYYRKFLDEGNPESEISLRAAYQSKFQKEIEDNVDSIYTHDLKEAANNKENLPISNDKIISQINESRLKMNQPLDGEKVLQYAQNACLKFDIPWNIYKELIRAESSWLPHRKYEGLANSHAAGLGQFQPGTFDKFIKYCESTDFFDEEYWGPRRKLTEDDRFNPYIMAFATAWLMDETKKTFPEMTKFPIHLQGIYYYIAHHDGLGGAKKFFRGQSNTNVLGLAKKVGLRALNSMSLTEIEAAIKFETDKEKEIKNQEIQKIQYGEEYLSTRGHKAEIHFSKNQKILKIGSSSVKGEPENSEIATWGIESAGVNEILTDFDEKFHNFPKPEKIVWIGVGLNEISSDGDNTASVIAKYKKAQNYFENMGIQFYCTTVQPADNKIVGANKLNEEIRKNFPGKVLDLAREITATDGQMKAEYKRDSIHMNSAGQDILNRLISKIT